MRKHLKPLIIFLLFSLFGYLFIIQDQRSSYMLYYTISVFVGMVVVFSTSYKLIRSKNIWPKWSLIVSIVFSIFYAISGYLYIAYAADLPPREAINYSLLYHPFIYSEVLPYLLFSMFLGSATGIQLKSSIWHKILIYTGISGLVIITGVGIMYFMDVSYDGDNNIRFIENDYQTLSELMAEPQFQNKIVYIDLWYSTCSPCIEQFAQLPLLKKRLDGIDVEYLYLGHPISAPNTYQLWKRAIKKYELSGWHVFMNDQFESDVIRVINENSPKDFLGYPRYLIVNRSNEIVNYNAPRPSEKDELVEQFKLISRN